MRIPYVSGSLDTQHDALLFIKQVDNHRIHSLRRYMILQTRPLSIRYRIISLPSVFRLFSTSSTKMVRYLPRDVDEGSAAGANEPFTGNKDHGLGRAQRQVRRIQERPVSIPQLYQEGGPIPARERPLPSLCEDIHLDAAHPLAPTHGK